MSSRVCLIIYDLPVYISSCLFSLMLSGLLVIPGVSCLWVLPCPVMSCLDVLLNIIIWVYILVCVFLFLPRVCTVTRCYHPDNKSHFFIKSFITCKTNNVIYIIRLYSPCNTIFVGETSRSLKERITEHRSAINGKDLKRPVARHFCELNQMSSYFFLGKDWSEFKKW